MVVQMVVQLLKHIRLINKRLVFGSGSFGPNTLKN